MCDLIYLWTHVHVGKGAIGGRPDEVVYEYPDNLQLQEYRLKNDRDIDLKECPAYETPINKQPDIELVDCPAYVEKKKDQDIRLKECPAYERPNEQSDINLVDCPAYVGQRKDQNIKLEECSAYGQFWDNFCFVVINDHAMYTWKPESILDG